MSPRSALAAAVSLTALLVLGSCGSAVPSSIAPGSPSGGSNDAASGQPSPSLPTPTPGLSLAASNPAPVAVADPALFVAVGLDASDGLTFQYDEETTARVAADPGLAKDVSAIAIGLYTVTGQQPAADYAIVSVVRLRDPSPDDEWFRSYRDSYDESACAQAGGVARHAEAPIGGRTVFIGSCAGGAFTYHTRLDPQGIVVSITAVGSGRLGERLAGEIAP